MKFTFKLGVFNRGEGLMWASYGRKNQSGGNHHFKSAKNGFFAIS